ncbi:MAG: DNA helicase RecQ [Firmicutes bacterium]|nr:DNA helicase RecQ [Bacillota bacterium]
MLGEIQKTLKKYFGYTSFKKGQEKIISSILQQQDTLAIMPTGGGKSICYQLPALLLPGVTLVISPLISLMKDQVDALNNLGIASTFINSALSQREFEDRMYLASKGQYKLIYIAPERLESERFLDLLRNLSVSLIAIDEAHCVSHWGHDFRPSYLSITPFIDRLSHRPIIAAFTATATTDVKQDIVSLLALRSPGVFVTGFDRENLTFTVRKGVNKSDFITDYLSTHKNQSGIIYAATRKEVDKLHEYLNYKGFSAGKYHAGLSDLERNEMQEAFIYDNVDVIVATNAFGMGIDKSNVRYVIHFNMPKNMESYYQEAGRAGRDGEQGECILLYGAADLHIQKFLIEQTLLSPERKSNDYQKLQSMVGYCHTPQCLRKYILEYFGETDVTETCENCGNCNDETELTDITIDAQKIFSCIVRMKEQYGINLVASVLKGSNIKRIRQLRFNELSTYGIMSESSVNEITDLINLLIVEEYLYVTEGQYPVVRIHHKAVQVLKGNETVMQKLQKKKEQVKEDSGLFESLRTLRKEMAEAENLPPYIIFHDRTLREMSMHCPTDRQSMLAINGLGEAKFEKYGQTFIEHIQKYVDEHDITPAAVTSAGSTDNPNKDKAEKIPSHMITYELYQEGKTLKEMAEEREMTSITIQNHLVRCAQEGYEIDWNGFIPAEYEKTIVQTIEQIGAERLKPIKDALPDEINYFAIRAVMCKYGF